MTLVGQVLWRTKCTSRLENMCLKSSICFLSQTLLHPSTYYYYYYQLQTCGPSLDPNNSELSAVGAETCSPDALTAQSVFRRSHSLTFDH